MFVSPLARPAIRLALIGAALLGAGAPNSDAADPVKWRTDYNSARKEAQEKGLPLFIDIGTDNCFYCRKLENGPFRDPAVAGLLNGQFVPLKVDANREPALARALKVNLYPTMVLAGADGKIHAFLEGYMEADRLQEHMKRALNVAGTPDYVARDFQEATRAIAAADYPRAVSLLKGVVKEVGTKPAGVKAKEVLDGIERQAAVRLARAKLLEEEEDGTTEALEILSDTMKVYAGTQAATDAATRIAGLGGKSEVKERMRAQRAAELLAMAKEELRTLRYYDCLLHCEQLAEAYADLTEGKEAQSLSAEVKANPERLATACEQMNDRTASLYLTLAESWAKKGQPKEAAACLEKVLKLAPESRHAEEAQGQLAKLKGKEITVPTGYRKPVDDR